MEGYIYMISFEENDSIQKGYLISITDFLLEEFGQLFGTDIVNNCIHLKIYNDSSANCPMLIINRASYQIRLAQSDLAEWNQMIYQLSHELGHFALSQKKTNKGCTLKWFEEIVCEALSLYALEFAAKNWDKCSLYSANATYSQSIQKYLENQLKKDGKDTFKNITSINELRKYEEAAEEKRETHLYERNALYEKIRKSPSHCRQLCFYQDYLISPDMLLIDFDTWLEKNDNTIIRCLS